MTVTWNARVTEAGTQEVAFKGIRRVVVMGACSPSLEDP